MKSEKQKREENYSEEESKGASSSGTSSAFSFELTEQEMKKLKREVYLESEKERSGNREDEDLMREVIMQGIKEHQEMGRRMDMMGDITTKVNFLSEQILELKEMSSAKFDHRI